MLQLTAEAAVHIRQLRPDSVDEGAGAGHLLRLSPASSGTQAGVTMSFVPTPHDNDQVGESHGILLCVDKAIAQQLDGMIIDQRSDDPAGLFIRAAT